MCKKYVRHNITDVVQCSQLACIWQVCEINCYLLNRLSDPSQTQECLFSQWAGHVYWLVWFCLLINVLIVIVLSTTKILCFSNSGNMAFLIKTFPLKFWRCIIYFVHCILTAKTGPQMKRHWKKHTPQDLHLTRFIQLEYHACQTCLMHNNMLIKAAW